MAAQSDELVEVEVLDGLSAEPTSRRRPARREGRTRSRLRPTGGGRAGPSRTGERAGEDHVGPVRRRRARRVARAVGALVCAAAVAVGGLSLLEHRAVVERRTALAGVEGLAPRLDVPPRELWRVPVRHGVDVMGEVVTTYEWHQGGVVAIVAHDTASRSTAWRVELDEASRVALVDCVGVVAHGARRAVVCQLFGTWEVDLRPAMSARTRQASLLHLDLATGEVLERRAVGAGASAAVVEDDLLTLTYGHDDVVVQRRGAEGARWVARLPRPAGEGPPVIDMRVEHGWVLLHGAVTAALDAGSGALRMAWPAALGRWEDAPFAGIGAGPGSVWVTTPVNQEAAAVVRRGSDGTPTRWEGRVSAAAVDDGSEEDVVLLDDGRGILQGHVVHEGGPSEWLWSVDVGRAVPLVRLDGRVVVADRAHVRALDVRTGAVRWSYPLGPADEVTTVTDGDVLVVLGYEVAVGRLLRAVDLDTGAVVWERPLPDRTHQVAVVDGLLVAIGGGDIVLLG